MIICAGDKESFEFATPIGIGMVDSAINLTRISIMNPPEFILFVGSAGSYGEKKIFDIIESKSASNIENSFFNANAYSPIDNVVSSATDINSEVIVNSSNYITTDENLSKRYLSHNIGIENMEFFSIIKVAQKFNIPVGGIFIVTNYCNSDAHKDFMSNHKEAMIRLTQYIQNRV
ncbi:Purine nucleoside phosphorylase [hydrothermal vent metagenome]|uniref:Purine nucleoside phosphorylase n=1 Tax=hydrothermal vent metagenome TaxID=652676 RepID=A0A1W1EI40_9ZZZZ